MATSDVSSAAVRVDLVLLWCAIGVALGIALALAMPVPTPSGDGMPTAAANITRPNPNLSPDEVVRLQLESLRAFSADDAAILQCFVLASPANRAATGPLDRFAAMVRNPKYAALVECEAALVGKMIIRGDQATVLVTVVDARKQPAMFRFFLSRQQDGPYRDCWMTDAVVAAETALPPPPEPPPAV